MRFNEVCADTQVSPAGSGALTADRQGDIFPGERRCRARGGSSMAKNPTSNRSLTTIAVAAEIDWAALA